MPSIEEDEEEKRRFEAYLLDGPLSGSVERVTINRPQTPINMMVFAAPVDYIPGRATIFEVSVDTTNVYAGHVISMNSSGFIGNMGKYSIGVVMNTSGSVSATYKIYNEGECYGCTFGLDSAEHHKSDCKWHDKFKTEEPIIQAIL